MSTTNYLGLTLTNALETGLTFLEWRSLINGVGCNSNMELIDGACSSLNSAIGGKADGFSFNAETGVLKLTSGGEEIAGSSITLDLKRFADGLSVVDGKIQLTNDGDPIGESVELPQSITDIEVDEDNILHLIDKNGNKIGDGVEFSTDGGEYDVTYDSETGLFTLYENDEPKTTLTITGGGGGGSSASNLSVRKITQSPLILTPTDKVEIEIEFSSTDSDGSAIDGTYSWKIGSRLLSTGMLVQGVNSFDLSKYVSVGTQKLILTVTDESGNMTVKSWTVQVVDVRIESAFNDRIQYAAGQPVSFSYTPYGSISKDVHFLIDGTEIETVNTATSGVVQSYLIPAKTHGTHLLECYITANINNIDIETDHIYKDIIWYDESATSPVIGCAYRFDHYGVINAKQYDTVSIEYNVFDPSTSMPQVTLTADGVLVSTSTLTGSRNIWSYRADSVGAHELVIACVGDSTTSVTIKVDVEELGIDVGQITGGLVVDFNPVGLTNQSEEREWTNGSYGISVSDNFDWANGGYKRDENGDTYFLIKSGTRATLNYMMFTGNQNTNITNTGSEMKLVFKTENVQDANAVWFSNVESVTNTVGGVEQTTKVGIQMGVHNGWLKTNNASDIEVEGVATTNTYLYLPYSEDDIIEMDINIDTLDREEVGAQSFVMAYEDGVPCKAYVYSGGDRFYQYTPQPIVIGSDYCDVRIYRLKIYSLSLSTESIMRNFIADSRDSSIMMDRYNRNSIYYNNETTEYTPYNTEGTLDPERLAPIVPNTKILMLETDHFTTSKKTFVKASLRCIHAGGGDVFEGDPYYDNWYFENGWHSGQGTTSDNYGISGRNVDFLFNCDGTHKPSDKVAADSGYVSQVTLGYGTEDATTESVVDWKGDEGKVSLTRDSVPNNFFNLKVNIASSENANNAILQKRYDDFLPYISPAKARDAKVKNSMGFVPAILFIRETNPDISTHNEFLDTNWHFYALGNIGDSKKTDYTRAYDPSDANEFVIEISDNTKNNAKFQTGVYMNEGVRTIESFTITETEEDGETIQTPASVARPESYVYPITLEEWNDSNNMRRWCIDNEAFDGDHSFEPRYACCGDYRDGKLVNDTGNGGKAQISKNNAVWRAFYRWVVTSTNAEFMAELDQWCVRSAVEFFYAYTHIYTMMDNRAKNTFWHFAKTGTYRQVSKPASELMHIYCELVGGEYVPTEDTDPVNGKTYYTQYAFDLWNYDNDTALGINNNGELIFPYGKEDTDYNIDGDPTSGYVYNGAQSVFWCRLRDLLSSEINTTFQTVANECFNANDIINEFDTFQECYPEEIWRLDAQRKYLRTFTGDSIDNSKPKKDVKYLRDMMQGRKKYQRRQWVRDQDIYFGTKHLFGNAITDDNKVVFRCYNPGQSAVVTPDYTLKITPYTDMYVTAMFGNGDTRSIRAKAGQASQITFNVSDATDTQVTVYGSSRIQAFDDLSACYLSTGTFSSAIKLKKLILGNTTTGYKNTRLTSLSLAGNAGAILEELDIRGCTALAGELNLVNFNNLTTLYAEGTKLRTVIFSTNGKLEIAHLPNTVTTLTMRNLNYLDDFDMDAFDSVETLTLEGGTLDSKDIVSDCTDTLRTLNLYNINWTLYDTSILADLYDLSSCYISGTIKITGGISNYSLERYTAKWNDVTFDVSEATIIPYYRVRFLNDDNSVVDEQYVESGSYATAPETNPTKASDPEFTYTFASWDLNPATTIITRDTDFVATYTSTIRTYTVSWYNGETLLSQATVNYGSGVEYTGDLPTDTSLETYLIYKMFAGWDKSTGYVTENIDVHAQYTQAQSPTDKVLGAMTPTELYALTKDNILDPTGANNTIISSGDEFDLVMGNDVNFTNVVSHEIVSVDEPVVFNGTNFVDSGIKLFDEDKSFVIALDFSFSDTTSGATLASCYDNNMGFKLQYSSGGVVRYGTSYSPTVAATLYREMVVIRHVKGDTNLYVYASNKMGDAMVTSTVVRSLATTHDATFVLGCSMAADTFKDSYAKGKVYWAKIWMDDLGASCCRKLAAWTRETITMQAAGIAEHNFRLFSRTDNGRYCNCCFLMKHLLDRTHNMNDANVNSGGWKDTKMRAWLNSRVFNGLPDQWKLIIKQVEVLSNTGNMTTTDIASSSDKIWLPSPKEVGQLDTTVPYSNESQGTFDIFTDNNSRIKYLSNGTGAAQYWWLRSPYTSYTTSFSNIITTGTYNGTNGASTSLGVCFGFCI